MGARESDIKACIKKALEHDSFVNYEISFTGSTGVSDGYACDVVFAKVLVSTNQNKELCFELACKINKKSHVELVEKAFIREVYFYEVILPEFTRFQVQNNIKDVFNSVPKCYKIVSNENIEFIVMDNLRKSGFGMYDRKKPLTLDHVKLILREYGKFHAISFALREKSKDDFEKLVTNFEDILLSAVTGFLSKLYRQGIERVCEILKKINETELYEMCHKIGEKGADVALSEIMKIVEPQSAILHGDCWSNNFLFKYESEDHKSPSKVAILDWQVTRLHSPVVDLSYLIYTTCSEEQLEHFDELLDVYYTSFSKFLTDLGCDSDALFPYSALLTHWKKYSLVGLLTVTGFLHIILCDNEDAPNNYDDSNDFADKMMKVKVKDESEYENRLISVIRHYFKYSSL